MFFQALAGNWRFARLIRDHGAMSGKASFMLDPSEQDVLHYQENGRLTLADGQYFAAQQHYVYRKQSAGFAIMFGREPDRLFQLVTLAQKTGLITGQARHDCTPDRYDSSYEFDPVDGSFTITHEVYGPRKHYAITTRYTPA